MGVSNRAKCLHEEHDDSFVDSQVDRELRMLDLDVVTVFGESLYPSVHFLNLSFVEVLAQLFYVVVL